MQTLPISVDEPAAQKVEVLSHVLVRLLKEDERGCSSIGVSHLRAMRFFRFS
jgi:hypothetical protein